ncbi:MAG: DUF4834 family protein [Salibacteraceae bacterium]
MGLLRTLGIILLIIGAVRLFTRFVLPWLLKKFARRVQRNLEEQMRNQMGDFSRNQSPQDEPDVKVSSRKKKPSKRKDDDFGEYVDFEEVE